PFFIGVQYHPELKSTVENPQPIFVEFVKAALQHAADRLTPAATRAGSLR
ncbi:MAG: glutamine amidotransferase-related protein, partial [bacterium]